MAAATKKMHVVTTSHRGVFAGHITKAEGTTVTLSDARMCVYWSTDVKGVVGLAATGPTKGCKITASAPAIELTDVTAKFECTPQAAAEWAKEPWTK